MVQQENEKTRQETDQFVKDAISQLASMRRHATTTSVVTSTTSSNQRFENINDIQDGSPTALSKRNSLAKNKMVKPRGSSFLVTEESNEQAQEFEGHGFLRGDYHRKFDNLQKIIEF